MGLSFAKSEMNGTCAWVRLVDSHGPWVESSSASGQASRTAPTIAFPASTPLAECAHAETIGTLFDCTLAPPPPELGEIDDSPWTTALCGDVKVQLFAHRGRRSHGDGGQLPAPTLVAFCWFHTSLLAVDESGVTTIPLEHIDLAESGAWCREKLEGMVLRLGWKEGALSGSAGGPALSNPLWSEEGGKAEL